MNRPLEPQKRQLLLEQCFAAILESGSLTGSINALAQRVGTSGRMLVYHFGSKEALERELVGLLESRLREVFQSFQQAAALEPEARSEPILQMWDYLTAPGMRALLKLSMDLSYRSLNGDEGARSFVEAENRKWIGFISDRFPNPEASVALLHLIQGAILDFLISGDSERGRRSIVTFLAQV